MHGRGRLNSVRGPTQLLRSGDCSTLGSLVKISSVSGDIGPGSRATCGGCCGLSATTGAATSSNGGRRGITATCGDGVCGWVATRGGKATRGWGVCGGTATRGSRATRGWGVRWWEATCGSIATRGWVLRGPIGVWWSRGPCAGGHAAWCGC